MKKLFRNFTTLLTHSGARSAFIRWIVAKATANPATLPNGMLIVPQPKFNDFQSIWRQHPCKAEAALLKELLPTPGILFDVGANVGLYTLLAHQEGLSTRTVAFEPIHLCAASWHRNIDLNHVPNAILLQCALGAEPGVARFTKNDTTPLNNRFTAAAQLASVESTFVSVSNLDSVTLSLGIDHIDLLKIDVEGAEPLVIEGADNLLKERRIQTIYMEFIIEFMEALGLSPHALFRRLSAYGYKFFEVNPEGSIGRRLDEKTLIDDRRAPPGTPEREFWGLNVIASLR